MGGPRLSPLLHLLPRRAVSRLLGQLGRARVPGPLLRAFLGWYARAYGADLRQAERPLEAYRTFLDFFTRRLTPDARPLPADPAAVASPADGRVVQAGPVERGRLLQAKGAAYPLAELLGGAAEAEALAGGTFLTVYLAPGDYHRFHWPLDGRLTGVRHLPGDLWPVNDRAVASVPRLFVRNERVALTGRTAAGAPFAVVPVGALNVGSIRLTALPRLRTNRCVAGASPAAALDLPGRRGEELGWFEFGSSIVLLLGAEAGRLDPLAPGTPLRMGQPVGRLAR